MNLNFLGIHFPLTAWVSIAHRISGVLLFLLIPGFLFLLQESLKSPQAFKVLKIFLRQPGCVGMVSLVLAILVYHTLFGIRHVLMDLQIGISKKSSLISARLFMGIAFLFFLTLCKRFL
jgi:succinate dehydrogenase / fumarate reductase cytochrome b subunit